MTDGRRWLALDADLFGKPFTIDLHQEFGWAGIGVWIAFLCACKRSRSLGTMRFLNEADARSQLGILGWDLADSDGKEWTLEDFWRFTGRKKQTRRTSRGREMNVTATHWERWQNAERTQRERERKSRSRAQKRPENVRANRDLDLDSDTPLPPRGGTVTSSSNGKGRTTPTSRPVADWKPEPQPDDVADPAAAIGDLRVEHGWVKPEAGGKTAKRAGDDPNQDSNQESESVGEHRASG